MLSDKLLEENEANLQKLKSELSRIQAREHVGDKRAEEAAHQVEACRMALEVFANQVYLREEITQSDVGQ